MKALLNKGIQGSIFGAVFLAPLFFLPFSFEKFEFNKFFLLFFMVLLGLVFWFMRMVLCDKELAFKKTPFNAFIFAVLGFGIFSTIFSADPWASLLGSYGRFSDGLLGLAVFAGFYFLAANNISEKYLGPLLHTLFVSLGIAIAVAYLSLFSVIQKNFNPVSAHMEGFVVVCAILAVFMSAVRPRAWSILLLAGSLGMLMVINFVGAWIALIAGLLGLLLFLVVQRIKIGEKLSLKNVWLPFALLIFAFIFLYSPLLAGQNFAHFSFQKELLLSQADSWRIGFKTSFQSVKNVLFGSGLATFGIDSLRFGIGLPSRNYLSELLGTVGFGGFFAQVALAMVALLAFALRTVFGSKKNDMAFFSSMGALLAAQSAYHGSGALAFLFWFVLALGSVPFENEFRLSLKKFFEVALLTRAALLCAIIGIGVLCVFGGRFYAADVAYAASQAAGRAPQLAEALKAVSLNPYRVEYAMRVSQLYAKDVLDELKKNPDKQDKQRISSYAMQAILFGTRSGALAPQRAKTWEFLGSLYKDLSFASGAQDWALQSFEKAETLEPQNPAVYNEVGKLYLQKGDFKNAEKQFDKAISLNPNFTDALLQRILLFEKEGDIAKAISRMQDLLSFYVSDPELLFQLGRLYYNDGQIPEAVSEFQQAIAIDPSYSNAHFALGAAYEKQGDKRNALKEFKKVLELNPNNKEVAEKLKVYKK